LYYISPFCCKDYNIVSYIQQTVTIPINLLTNLYFCSELSSGIYCRVKSLMMEAVRTSETSVVNYFTRQYIPEDNSEHHTRRRENLKSNLYFKLILFVLNASCQMFLDKRNDDFVSLLKGSCIETLLLCCYSIQYIKNCRQILTINIIIKIDIPVL
jgi:hypothetical protein